MSLKEKTVPGLHEFMLGRLPVMPRNASILDIGCGTGAWLARLQEAGFSELIGIDVNIEEFALESIPVLRFNLDDEFVNLKRSFDVITAIELVEHLENPGRLFFQVARYLKDDGVFVMTTPNIHSIVCRLRFLLTGRLKSFDNKGDPTHIFPVCIEVLPRVLKKHGLYVESLECYPTNNFKMARYGTRLLSRLLSFFLVDPYPGDTLIFLIRKGVFL